MRRRGRVSNTTAGVIAILLIACGTYLAATKRFPWQGDWELKAVLSSANELHTRTPVRIAGVEVGKVKKTERGPGRTTIVTMAIKEQGLPIHRDATLKVRPRIFLEGNFFIDLRPGTPSSPELEKGGTLPISQTAIPVQLDEILSGLQKGTRDNLQQLVAEFGAALDHGGAKALNRSLPYWSPAFEGVAISSEAVRGEREGDLAGFTAAGGQTAEAVSRGRRLASLVEGLNRTLRALAARRAQLAASLPALDGLLREAAPAFDALDRAFPPTRAFVREIRPALRQAPETLRLANPLLREARKLLRPRELPALLDELDPALRSLGSLEPKLIDAFDRLTPVTECLRRNALPTLKKPIPDDDLSTNEPVYRELLYPLTGLSSASQNFDGNGPAVRYHAGFGDQMVTFGRIPTANEPLVGLTSEPLLGSRPRKPASDPPFRPDVPCVTQKPPELRAATGPAPEQQQVSALPRRGRRR